MLALGMEPSNARFTIWSRLIALLMAWRTSTESKGFFCVLKTSLNVQPSAPPHTGPDAFQDTSLGLRALAASKLPASSERPMSTSPLAKSWVRESAVAGR